MVLIPIQQQFTYQSNPLSLTCGNLALCDHGSSPTMYSSIDVETDEEEKIMLGDNGRAGDGDAIAMIIDDDPKVVGHHRTHISIGPAQQHHETLPSVASVAHKNYMTSVGGHCGPRKLGLLLSARYGQRKLDNFRQLPIKPTEITLPHGRHQDSCCAGCRLKPWTGSVALL
jgi:hypothetical protein